MTKFTVLLGLLVSGASALAEPAPFIAGLVPDSRPAGAPVITVFEQTPIWWERAHHGIDPPRNGIGFLKYQGAWYTPFIYPNLKDPYDIRGMYNKSARKD